MNDTLVAIGEALIDFIPDKTGCKFSEVTAFSPALGGAPANVCGAFSRLGGSSRLISQLGDDPFGHKIIEELRDIGVDTSSISMTNKANTALAFVSLGSDGNRIFSFYRKPSADMLLEPFQITERAFENAFALHFCSVDLGDFPMKYAHIRAIELMRDKGGLISFDPNLRFQLWNSRDALKKTVHEFIPLTDILKISDEELEFITGKTDINLALDELFTGRVKLVILTCGKKGAWAFTKKNSYFADSEPVSAVDTTGAGDGFIGSFLWKLHEFGIDADDLSDCPRDVLRECVDFSNKFCSISVTKHGSIASYPDLDTMNKNLFS